MRNLALVALLLLVAIAGCKSVNNSSPNGGGVLPPSGSIADYNEDRMEPALSPVQATLTGRITLTGFTLATGPLPGGTGTGPKVLAHLVDDEDDILSAALDQNGYFSLVYSGSQSALKLKITADTTSDLDGNGTSNDQIVQTVPVRLLLGYTANVDMAIIRGAKTMMESSLWPAKGAVIISDMIRQDGNGRGSNFFGTYLADGFAIVSTDGDKLLEAKDLRQTDLNRNGWPDGSEQLYSDPGLVPATLEGMVVTVSLVNRTLLIQGRSGDVTLIYLQPFAALEPLVQSGYFGSGMPLDQSLIGRWVMATGRMAPEGLLADWVVVGPAGLQ